MNGRRLPDFFDEPEGFTWDQVQPGDYFKSRSREGDAPLRFYIRSPNGESGSVTSAIWSITEHEDGTITVSPSIWFNKERGGWHGYLVRGVFQSCGAMEARAA